MNVEEVSTGEHWGAVGAFISPDAGAYSYVELRPLLYQYWQGLFPDAESVDFLVEEMLNDMWDHYEQWAAVTWSPDNIGGGTSSLLGVLTLGDHSFVAQEPDFDFGHGWLLFGETGDKQGAIWNFLVDLFNDACPIPDAIEADLSVGKIRDLLERALSDDPAAYFGWGALAGKLGLDTGDRDAVLDRYVDGYVQGNGY